MILINNKEEKERGEIDLSKIKGVKEVYVEYNAEERAFLIHLDCDGRNGEDAAFKNIPAWVKEQMKVQRLFTSNIFIKAKKD